MKASELIDKLMKVAGDTVVHIYSDYEGCSTPNIVVNYSDYEQGLVFISDHADQFGEVL